jgi:hypothetical protein
MDYYVKPSKLMTKRDLFLAGVLIVLFSINVWALHHNYLANVALLFLLPFVILLRSIRFIKSYRLNRPVLTATDEYIYDHLKDKKFFWRDISEVDGYPDHLLLKFYHPEKYFGEMKKTFLNRLFPELAKSKETYWIYTFMIDKKDTESFLETLNNYSLQAVEK